MREAAAVARSASRCTEAAGGSAQKQRQGAAHFSAETQRLQVHA